MSKLLVETSDHFMLMDRSFGQEIQAQYPAVVTVTAFIQTRISNGQINVLGKLKDDASVEAWDEVRVAYTDKKGKLDVEAATEAYLAEFGLNSSTKKQTSSSKPAPKKSSTSKKTEETSEAE